MLIFQAAIAMLHTLGGWNNQNVFSHISGEWKGQGQGARRVRVWGELSLLQIAVLSLCPHMVRPQHVGVSSGLSSYKNTILVALEVGSRPHLTFITTS